MFPRIRSSSSRRTQPTTPTDCWDDFPVCSAITGRRMKVNQPFRRPVIVSSAAGPYFAAAGGAKRANQNSFSFSNAFLSSAVIFERLPTPFVTATIFRSLPRREVRYRVWLFDPSSTTRITMSFLSLTETSNACTIFPVRSTPCFTSHSNSFERPSRVDRCGGSFASRPSRRTLAAAWPSPC